MARQSGQSGSAEDGPSGQPVRRGPSLKAQAIALLARREHSRLELQRKLQSRAESPDDIPPLLDELEQQGLLSNERFAQSLVHRRAAGRGVRQVAQELRRHGLASEIIESVQESLSATEPQRAKETWEKKFGVPPASQKEYARQARFLASRGFSTQTIQRLLGDIPRAG